MAAGAASWSSSGCVRGRSAFRCSESVPSPGQTRHRANGIHLCHTRDSCGHAIENAQKFAHTWGRHDQISRGSKYSRHAYINLQSYKFCAKRVASSAQGYPASHDDDHKCDLPLMLGFNLSSHSCQSSNSDSNELDVKERLRRIKISKANEGKVPWNKGRKHNAETIQKIRERTKLAMQDPKVKMKLKNFGHAQSHETRTRISIGVREGWRRRRNKIFLQATCIVEWQNLIAEECKEGFAGDEELQWNSYEIIAEQLKQEWLESIEKRKNMRRPKGSKRAPKSSEQRRKISKAISAKWEDPVYRERVCSAISKYHGSVAKTIKRPRRKPVAEKPVRRWHIEEKAKATKDLSKEIVSTKRAASRKTINCAPSYKDPLASYKLEMIKELRQQREANEARKREAIERAKLLVSEAEKAAKVLEEAAKRSLLANASLLEARTLIAEAKWYIQSMENRKISPFNRREDVPLSMPRLANNFHVNPRTPASCRVSNKTNVNEASSRTGNANGDKESSCHSQIAVPDNQSLIIGGNTGEGLSEVGKRPLSDCLQEINAGTTGKGLQMTESAVNGSASYNELPSKEEDIKQMLTNKSSELNETKRKRRWVHGKFIEVQEE